MDRLDMHNITIPTDAFSSGQISSKIWLCRELEKLNIRKPQIVYVYGGWIGVASFLLLTREKYPIKHIRSFDIDAECEVIADQLMENYVWQQWKFKAVTADCNKIDFNTEQPDLVINCSTEHFDSLEWFDAIPEGTLLALQNNDMPHDQHSTCVGGLKEMIERFPLQDIKFTGQMDFCYPTWQFSRFMIIGRK